MSEMEPAPTLIVQLAATDAATRRAAAEKMSPEEVDAPIAVPALLRALRDSDYLVRYHSLVALRRFGPDASDAVPALRQIFHDPGNRQTAEPCL